MRVYASRYITQATGSLLISLILFVTVISQQQSREPNSPTSFKELSIKDITPPGDTNSMGQIHRLYPCDGNQNQVCKAGRAR